MLSGCSGGTQITAPGGDGSLASLPPEEQIMQAAGKGDMTALESLLASDATLVDALGMNGMTPLHAAAATGQNAAVKYLLESGADPLAEDENSGTPLNAARVEGHADTAQIIEDWIAGGGDAPAQ